MKYNGPCADTAGSAGEGLRKKGGTPMRKRNKVVSLLLAGCMAAGLLAGCGSSGEAQVATADNATAASTSTGAADSAAPETAGESGRTDQSSRGILWKQLRCTGYGMALDDGRVLRRTDA